MTEKARLVLALVLIFGIGLPLGTTIKNKWPAYWAEYDFKSLEKVYFASQYVSTDPSGWIPDEAIYSYAAGAYLRGVNPILVNPEHPPLGKYFISLFILLFNRANLSILVFGLGSVFWFFVLSRIVLKSTFWALLAVFFLIRERLFIEQFVYIPLLDIIKLFFIFLAFIFFLKGTNSPKFFFGAHLFLGFVAATKFYLTAGLIFIAWVGYLLLFVRTRKGIGYFFLFAPLVLMVLAASYFRYFILGGDLRDFLGVLKWVFLFHKGKGLSWLHFWDLVFLNKWRVWWGEKDFIPSAQWQISWPISVLGALFVSLGYFLKKKPFWGNFRVGVIISWVLVYLMFLSVSQASPRYLIPLLPFSHLVSVYGIKQVLKGR